MQEIKNIIEMLDKSIKEDAENSLLGGNIIKDNYDEKVDKYRATVNNSMDWLTNYQSKIIKETGINNLKIKFTNASGYFIEISKSQVSKIPDNFVHKQSLVNASRFITSELKEFEQEIIEAESVLAEREYKIFCDIRETILDSFKSIKNLSIKTAVLDFGSALSRVAYENNYSRPKIGNNYNLEIKYGRHPIIEKIENNFISNDLQLNKKSFVHIITGPNMGGKSTFLRQNALIIIMAHIGSFVPVGSCSIPLTDKIFSRVGASDNLFLGQSTFMVEMQEVANILNNSTEKSFVIIDEVGRGTSTYDGMSLAWAILKHNHDKIKAKTLFATHYHELVDESKGLSGVDNFSVSVGEDGDNLVFLRKIIPGSIGKSFGLEVAKLAGISSDVLDEARNMLKLLETQHNKTSKQLSFGNMVIEPEVKIVEKKSKVEEELKNLNVDSLTPIQALNKLSELKGKIK